MNYNIIIGVLCFLIFEGCSSSARFTSQRNRNDNNTNPPETTVSNITLPETNYDEYKDAAVLETVNGVASYYSTKFDGRKTSSGEVYKNTGLTAAHTIYPYNTIVRLTNLKNNKSVIVKINDRKPNLNGRIIDVSYKAAEILGMVTSGIAKVKLEVLKMGIDSTSE